ncbi:MAG: hypothetical protein HYS46_07430 [Betaproteobacteria bacterium]|nr:hypothetical protein [Betaproteobacteria bacterium]
MRRAVRIIIAGLILATGSTAVQAVDPLVLFVLRLLRDHTISTGIRAGIEAAQEKSKQPAAPIEIPRAAPQADDQWLRGLIDESFVHLGPQQREELYASLMKMLNDPKNAAMRTEIIAEFTSQAIAMRDAHRQLSRLSSDDMRTIAAEARREYERLPAEQRQQMLQVLQHGIPGMPQALSDLMLAEFGGVPAR